MKISIDFDGTLWSRMAFFREFMFAMQARGHQVGMLTGHSHDMESKDVALMLARGFPKPDFYFGRTPDYMHLNGAHFKSMVIKREGIAMHFDDYDYDNPDTDRLFKELGQEEQIARVKARTPIEVNGHKIHYE